MSLPPRLVPRAGPNVWAGETMLPTHWMLPVGGEAAGELLGAAGKAAGGARPERPEDAPLPLLAPVLRNAADRLEHGAGFALLRGLAADRFTPETAAAALLAVAAHLGAALPQDADGTLVAPPKGAPGQLLAEPADAVAIFCLRAPPEGEDVRLHSAANLHNELLRRNRAALAALHLPLPYRRGGEAAGTEPLMVPVFGTTGGAFVGRYDRAALIESTLDPAQAAAVSMLDAVAAAPGQALSIPLRAGDLLLLNPHLVWRRGSAPSAGEPRLLGVWLSTRTSRALPESFRAVFGNVAAGARRGGAAGGPGMVGG